MSSSSYISTDWQSASLSRCRAPIGAGDQMLISLSGSYFLSSSCRVPSLTRGRNPYRVRVILRPTVSRPVRLGVGRPLEQMVKF
jgi:hypothetical protein